MSITLKEQIIRDLFILPDDRLKSIARIIKNYKKQAGIHESISADPLASGITGPDMEKSRLCDLTEFFGSISKEEADEMRKAVEDCRRIDKDAW